MNIITFKIPELENFFGFKNKIKWQSFLKILLYHILGVWWVWKYALPAKFMTICFFPIMFFINGAGITAGVHRLFTHKSYKVKTPLKIFILVCFTSAGQNSVYQWVRDHRLHHKFSDTDADPHNANRGFFFSHIGWLMTYKNDEVIKQGKKIDMSDIENDKHIMFFSRYSTLLNIIFCFVLPTLMNIYFFNENWKCAIAWQCFIRYLHVFHNELTVNSLAHIYGYTPYNSNILPKQNVFVAVNTFGEGWHNYHHVFPYDYKAAEFCDFFNVTARLIRFWEKMGWAYDLKEASPDLINSVTERLTNDAKIKEN